MKLLAYIRTVIVVALLLFPIMVTAEGNAFSNETNSTSEADNMTITANTSWESTSLAGNPIEETFQPIIENGDNYPDNEDGLSAFPGLDEAILGLQVIKTKRVSIRSNGDQGDGDSKYNSISKNGRYVAFESDAANLVDGDTNGKTDIFVYYRKTGRITRVSVRTNGVQGDDDSYNPSISKNGRYVAFQSSAANLVDGDTNGAKDIFVHDCKTGETTRVSVRTNGKQGDQNSWAPSISSDGRYVAFSSIATNLVNGDTNGDSDVFVHDRETGKTTRVSVRTNGKQGDGSSRDPSISSDGRYVAFNSFANNLVNGDTNVEWDVFVHDREMGKTTRVSVRTNGYQGDGDSDYPSISSDGRYVAFESYATNLVNKDTNGFGDVFVHDRETGKTTRVSVRTNGGQGDQNSCSPSISSDGRYVAFYSSSTNLVNKDTNGARDIFVHDRKTGKTTRVSVRTNGKQGDDDSFHPSISSDGRYIAFYSYATNLVNGDTNGKTDVFVTELGT